MVSLSTVAVASKKKQKMVNLKEEVAVAYSETLPDI
jgi:hypothetical protein